MVTKKSASTEIPQQLASSANAYIERMSERHERFAARVEKVRARNTRIADKFVEALFAGQRDALNLGKTLAAEPTAYAKNMEAFVQSLSVAQERSLDVAKTVYREQAEAGSELRSLFETAVASTQSFTKPFEKMNAMWMPASK